MTHRFGDFTTSQTSSFLCCWITHGPYEWERSHWQPLSDPSSVLPKFLLELSNSKIWNRFVVLVENPFSCLSRNFFNADPNAIIWILNNILHLIYYSYYLFYQFLQLANGRLDHGFWCFVSESSPRSSFNEFCSGLKQK